jgi:hypothetical protein
MSTESFEYTFEVATPARLRVGNVRGHVDVQPGDDGTISVSVVRHNKSGSNGQTKILVEQEKDGLVVAEAKYENTFTNFFGLNKPCKVDFTIKVPKACSVQVNCVSSTAKISGLEGDFDVQGVSGDIHLEDLSGDYNFNSVSGKVTAKNLAGAIEMNNVSGKVEITEAQISKLFGKSVSGSTIIETPLSEGPYEFNSVSGNVSFITPEDTACTIYIKSMSGRAKVNLPVTSRSGPKNNEVIEVAGGGPTVSLKSVSGILKVGSPNYETTEEQQPETESDPTSEGAQSSEPMPEPKTQMQILQEIENGEISVEEALELLNP